MATAIFYAYDSIAKKKGIFNHLLLCEHFESARNGFVTLGNSVLYGGRTKANGCGYKIFDCGEMKRKHLDLGDKRYSKEHRSMKKRILRLPMIQRSGRSE